MKIRQLAETELSINLSRKLAKPLAICIIALFLVSMVLVLASTSVQAANTAGPLHTSGQYIVDANNHVIYLRGLQKVEMADDPDGTWMGNTNWNDQNVKNELAAMKTWGANTIRCIQSIDNWKYNLNTPYAAINNRDAVTRLANYAAEQNMYVIFTAYRVTNYFNGGNQDPLPYPPYQTSNGASSVISSKQDFINYWADVANTLKNYPNVIFEIWNEPNGDATAMTGFFAVQQQVINAIRATGAQNIIMAQWDYGSWVNMDYPPPNSASTMDWITQANLQDPLNNLVYVTHIYREYGQTGMYTDAASISKWGTNHVYDYNEMVKAFQYEKLDWVMNTLHHPLFVTELGFNEDLGGNELNYEKTALTNELNIFNSWGVNYIVHWWREIGIFRLTTGAPNFNPTTGGAIVKTILSQQAASQPAQTVSDPTSTSTAESSIANSKPTSTTTPKPTLTPTPTPLAKLNLTLSTMPLKTNTLNDPGYQFCGWFGFSWPRPLWLPRL